MYSCVGLYIDNVRRDSFAVCSVHQLMKTLWLCVKLVYLIHWNVLPNTVSFVCISYVRYRDTLFPRCMECQRRLAMRKVSVCRSMLAIKVQLTLIGSPLRASQ